jgi:CubicO group peptidase (beta-lactamase class C family)
MTHDRFDALTEQIHSGMQRMGVPGVAVGVLYEGREQAAGLGVTSAEHPLPVTAETLFQIGSISKTVLGTALMALAERGALELDAQVRRYLPDFLLADAEAAEQLTIRHLLTHTGGFQGDFFIDTGWGDDALERYVTLMAGLPQLAPPGELWSYCNSGFSLAGRVVEVVTGKTAEASISELVFAPLGMDRAFFFPAEVMTHRFAVGHRVGAAGAEVLRPWPIPRASNPAGGVSTSVAQLLRYGRFHLEGGAALSGESRALMQAAQAPAGNFADQVGITWMLRTVGGTQLVRHGGATNGQMAELVLAPERGFGLALLTNADRGGVLNTEIVKSALAQFLDVADPDPQPVELPEAQLAEYAGRYTAALTEAELRVEAGGLVAQLIPRGGFPTADSPPPPAPPPTRLAFTGTDKVVALDPPFKDSRGEFLRDAEGRIAWLRTGGRVHRRVAG